LEGVAWIAVTLRTLSLRYAVVGAAITAFGIALTIVVCVVVPLLILRSRLRGRGRLVAA
jgi:hypothetical protein